MSLIITPYKNGYKGILVVNRKEYVARSFIRSHIIPELLAQVKSNGQ